MSDWKWTSLNRNPKWFKSRKIWEYPNKVKSWEVKWNTSTRGTPMRLELIRPGCCWTLMRWKIYCLQIYLILKVSHTICTHLLASWYLIRKLNRGWNLCRNRIRMRYLSEMLLHFTIRLIRKYRLKCHLWIILYPIEDLTFSTQIVVHLKIFRT